MGVDEQSSKLHLCSISVGIGCNRRARDDRDRMLVGGTATKNADGDRLLSCDGGQVDRE